MRSVSRNHLESIKINFFTLVRKINGPRPENEGEVYHLVAEMLTMKDIKELNLDEDAKVRSYATLDLTEALQACHEGDTIILFPGTYEYENIPI